MKPVERPRGFWRVLCLFLVVVWGLQAFFGLSTTSSMAMHSNLRTEVEGNHLLLGSLPPLFSFQKDPVSWNNYLALTAQCSPQWAHGNSSLTPLEQWGRAPFGHFEWIPRYELDKTLLFCREGKVPTKSLISLRPYDWPGPNRCRK